ncbi:MAG: prepilin-type N-terminal cleavage/methylation domain-containing protein [Proteobacteria bacterium]|nr:prepilin-type N-terminal cleavage/methylation domain-containing protein [Pseudomonadota bacterium]MDE3208125.1 prepilin-type N-terminal cleavage/methylation domain-containing protein [Pseudomonadota bacterium]
MRTKSTGFTLIELLVTTIIVGILASIAIPAYQNYIRRSALTEATNDLANYRVAMEQYYQDNMTYASGTSCGAPLPTGTYFTFSCTISGGGSGFTATATGSSSLTNGFSYTINDQNIEATTGIGVWGSLPSDSGNTWIVTPP